MSLLNFWKKGGSDFSYKKGGVGKIGGCFKHVGIIYFHTKQPIPALSFSECLVYVCFVYLHQYYFKNLVLYDLEIYFYKSKEISMMWY